VERVPTPSRGLLCLIACDSGLEFTKRIITELQRIYAREPELERFQFTPSEEVVFANGEIKTVIKDNIRGQDVYVVQCIDDPVATDRSVNDNLMAGLTAINAAYNSDAESVTAVLPQFPYSRQERKKTRESITALQVSRFLEASGANRVLTIDIHSEAIEGFLSRAHLENLHAYRAIAEYFTKAFPADNLIVVAPDVGSADRARAYAKIMKTDLAIVDKERDYNRISSIKGMSLVGDVRGKNVFMGDDLVATGGTLVRACQLLKEKGAEEVYLACSLPFFSGKAVELLAESHEKQLFKALIGTDAVFRGKDFCTAHPWYREVSVAPLFARVIHNINQKRSVSQLLV
jgi:ribose-phosphate pyrophosphokinase